MNPLIYVISIIIVICILYHFSENIKNLWGIREGFVNLTGKDLAQSGRCANYNEGILRSIQQYKDGLDHGKWKFYYKNGKLETVANFEMGKRIGKWKYYHENGSLKQVSYYKNGERN